jgi:hypothetical protein
MTGSVPEDNRDASAYAVCQPSVQSSHMSSRQHRPPVSNCPATHCLPAAVGLLCAASMLMVAYPVERCAALFAAAAAAAGVAGA